MSEAGRDAALAALVSQIEDLQSRLLFQDDALSQLDEVVIAQAGQLARLAVDQLDGLAAGQRRQLGWQSLW